MRKPKAEKERKRRTVATGIVAGETTAAIAKKAGCSARNVQRLAAEPATQFIITEALRPHRAKLEKLAQRAILAIERALIAHKTDTADHVVRMRAVERYGDLLTMAQGKPPEPKTTEVDGIPQLTWEEFTLLYQSRRVTASADQSPSTTSA
jgi:hypothetical protein